jgi:metal-responsive CopG/Arc/MetJ family transcriptional regulator
MEQSITVTLPPDVRQALDDFVRREGRSENDVVGEAVKEHLMPQRSRSLQEGQATEADLDAFYPEMAADEAREADAHQWAEATLGDAHDAAR